MMLKVKDVTKLLEISEKTLHKWIAKRKFPAHEMNDQYHFVRSEILEWATANRIPINPQLFLDCKEESGHLPSLKASLEAGGIIYRLEGNDRESILRSMVRYLRLPPEVDPDFVYELILAREKLGSTGIGDGIAIPHPRSPLIFNLSQPMLALFFLEQPIDFSALDGKPVFALFCILSLTARGHIHMISRLAYALQDSRFRELIQQQGSRETILTELQRVESSLLTS